MLDRSMLTREELEAENAALRETLRRVQRIGVIGSVEVDLREGQFKNYRSPEYLLIHGLPPDAHNESHEQRLARIHPDDRPRMEQHFLDAVRSGDRDYTAEYRVVRPSDGETRWIFAKGVIERDDAQTPLRFVGAHMDITERRLLEQRTETIAREFAHRVKNIGAVVSSLVRMSARTRPEARAFADDLLGRIAALFRAKELVRPSRDQQSGSHSLQDLLSTLLAPYQGGESEIRIGGNDTAISATASAALALAIHELATNAVKYGVLGQSAGTVVLDVHAGEELLSLEWLEAGQRPVAPGEAGFGSELMQRTIGQQLRGTLKREWLPHGLRVKMSIPIERIQQ